MRIIGLFVIALLSTSNNVLCAQDIIEWAPSVKLSLEDFKSKSSQIGNVNHYTVMPSTQINFSFQMRVYEFVFTRNFNSKVSTTFERNASVLIAPDEITALKLVKFAQLGFDLAELYSRKLRKILYENKGAFSDTNFFQKPYDETVKEYNQRIASIGIQTDVGHLDSKTDEIQKQIIIEIDMLSDFCQSCKPKKK